VWITFNKIEEVFTNLVNTYPVIVVPKLIPMSTSQYEKLRNNIISSNNDIEKACFFMYQFKNNHPGGKSYSSCSPPESDPALKTCTIDKNRLYHEKVLVVNWLKSVQSSPSLANSEYIRQLFRLKPYVEKPILTISRPTPPVSASKNKTEVVDDGIVRFTGDSYDNIRYSDTHQIFLHLFHVCFSSKVHRRVCTSKSNVF